MDDPIVNENELEVMHNRAIEVNTLNDYCSRLFVQALQDDVKRLLIYVKYLKENRTCGCATNWQGG